MRAGSLRPRGTCYSFSSISSASLWLLVFILPHYSFSLSFIFYLSCLRVPLPLSKSLCLEITFWYAACSLTLGHPRSLIALTFWQFGNSLFDTGSPSWRVLRCVAGIQQQYCKVDILSRFLICFVVLAICFILRTLSFISRFISSPTLTQHNNFTTTRFSLEVVIKLNLNTCSVAIQRCRVHSHLFLNQLAENRFIAGFKWSILIILIVLLSLSLCLSTFLASGGVTPVCTQDRGSAVQVPAPASRNLRTPSTSTGTTWQTWVQTHFPYC